MQKYRNPFEVLGASPRDSRRKLASLAEDAALLGDEAEARKAYAALLNPDTRLMAEIRWMLNEQNGLFHSVWLCKKHKWDADEIEALCGPFDDEKMEPLTETINAARQEAGICLTEGKTVQAEANACAEETAKNIADGFGTTASLGKALLALAQRCLTKEKIRLFNNRLLGALAKEYQLRAAAETEQEREKISRQVKQIEEGGRINITREIKTLCHLLACWNELVLPIRLLNAARGLRHQPSEDCFWEAYRVYKWLFFMSSAKKGKQLTITAQTEKPQLQPCGIKERAQLADTFKACFSDVEALREPIEHCWTTSHETLEAMRKRNAKEGKELLIGAIVIGVCILLAIQAGDDGESRWKLAAGLACMALAWTIHHFTKKHLS